MSKHHFTINEDHLQEVLSYPEGWNNDYVRNVLYGLGISRYEVTIEDLDLGPYTRIRVICYETPGYRYLYLNKKLTRPEVERMLCEWIFSWE